jgi:hypothetical protein
VKHPNANPLGVNRSILHMITVLVVLVGGVFLFLFWKQYQLTKNENQAIDQIQAQRMFRGEYTDRDEIRKELRELETRLK